MELKQGLPYNRPVKKEINAGKLSISVFESDSEDLNKDDSVIESFGEEWLKFDSFSETEIKQLGESYFDILSEDIINKDSIIGDFGGGTGRFSKYLADKVKFVEFVDPSEAVYSAAKLLQNESNVRLTKASIGSLPFDDESFDFVMSIGVLHHIPDTNQAMADCVKKVKDGGYFYTYLYYALDNRGFLFRSVYNAATLLRRITSNLPGFLKRFVCDLIAVFVYLPLIMLSKFLGAIGLKKVAKKVPLSFYSNTTWNIVRNDALDRFGTTLEQRFTKEEIKTMMENCGLENIKVSDGAPYWHAVGKKLKA